MAPPPLPEIINGELEYHVEKVLAHRLVGRHGVHDQMGKIGAGTQQLGTSCGYLEGL